MKDRTNIYLAARAAASRRDRLLANRDRAAERLHVSVQALSDYETGETLPPCDVVQWMVDVYEDPDLRARHMRACCPLMTEGLPEPGSDLRSAALAWITAITDVTALGTEFARVARDGEITPDEREAAARIRRKAVELTQAMLETISALDRRDTGC